MPRLRIILSIVGCLGMTGVIAGLLWLHYLPQRVDLDPPTPGDSRERPR